MIGFLVAILSGALMSIQGVWNTEATKQSGMWLMAAYVQLTAFFVCLVAYVWQERMVPMQSILRISPKYFLLSGVIGAFITMTVVKSIHILGPAKGEMLIVASQLIVAYIIELFGMFGTETTNFSWKKMVAVCIFLVGIILFKSKSL
ncbi:MAG: DMT family transporter [Lachnospiraceae bacterium]|nr:DMT family transporter [Lachnospiraceae bacterium]